MGHTTGTSASLEERVRETTLEGLHWSGRVCQVREIQHIQARGGSRLMAEAADGRDGWSARRGRSTIDVIGAGQMTAHLAGAGQGARDPRPGGHSHLSGERASAGCAAAGWVSQPGFTTRPAWCVGFGVFVCVCARTCVCACGCVCVCTRVYLRLSVCIYLRRTSRLQDSWYAFVCAPLCVHLLVCVHAHPQSVRAPFSLGPVRLCVQVCVCWLSA